MQSLQAQMDQAKLIQAAADEAQAAFQAQEQERLDSLDSQSESAREEQEREDAAASARSANEAQNEGDESVGTDLDSRKVSAAKRNGARQAAAPYVAPKT